MTPDEYVNAIAGRLQADGVELSTADVGGLRCMIGYRSQFKVQWMATKLHLFTVVAPTELRITAEGLEGFSNAALDFAINWKGGLMGLQVGVAAIPIMVSPNVDASAASYALSTLVRRFSAFAWPAVIDTSLGQSYSHEGAVMIGGIYSKFMRKNTNLALGK